MENWKTLLHNSITTYDELKKHLGCDNRAIEDVISRYPLRINPYFLSLIEQPGDPIWIQAVPDEQELSDPVCIADPLGEENLSAAPNLVHKYPDRVLFLVSRECAMYCRFCTRKRKVGTDDMHISKNTLEAGYAYIAANPGIKEVLISGGDPLMLDDDYLADILYSLRQIPSVEVIRIGTRMVSTLPMRVTPKLVRMLKMFHPLYINTHFNHPRELTDEARKACSLLADAGIPLGCQTVLLRSVNDSAETLKQLFRGLLSMRVKPYYLFQADLTRGTNHLRTTSSTGIDIMRNLYGHLSGLAIPTYALDGPGGKGKIPLTPDYVISRGENLIFTNFRGELCTYPESGDGI